jgi:hypothetical protein
MQKIIVTVTLEDGTLIDRMTVERIEGGLEAIIRTANIIRDQIEKKLEVEE